MATKKNPSLSVGRGEKLPASRGADSQRKVVQSTTKQQAAKSKHLRRVVQDMTHFVQE